MTRTCEDCGVEYDDTYRYTLCPHERFEMHCKIYVRGEWRCCHTVEEVRAAMRERMAA